MNPHLEELLMWPGSHGPSTWPGVVPLWSCPLAQQLRESLSWKERETGLRPRDCSHSCRQRLRSNGQGQVIRAILFLLKAANLSPANSLELQTTIPNSALKCSLRVHPTKTWQETAPSLWRSHCHWIHAMCQARRGNRVQVGDWGGRTRALENIFRLGRPI